MKGKVLGEGAFAIVRTAIHTVTEKHVAIKTYNKLQIIDKDIIKAIHREADLMKKIDSPYVVKFIEMIENTRNIHVVMEYAGRHSLKDYLATKEGEKLKISELRQLLYNILLGLQAIHSIGIIHRDLKIENVVMNSIDTPKIVDFGFAREIGTQMGVCGTLNYMAPELVEKHSTKKQSDKTDVWAMGVIFYYTFLKKFPFVCQTETEMKKCILESEPDMGTIDALDQSLIKSMLRKDADLRPTCMQILLHPCFQDVPNKIPPPVVPEPVVSPSIQKQQSHVSPRQTLSKAHSYTPALPESAPTPGKIKRQIEGSAQSTPLQHPISPERLSRHLSDSPTRNVKQMNLPILRQQTQQVATFQPSAVPTTQSPAKIAATTATALPPQGQFSNPLFLSGPQIPLTSSVPETPKNNN
jgi:serine/threonine protein kinase